MKTIKYIAAAVMCLLSLTTNAQTKMIIELEGGKQMELPVSSITSIRWFTNETTPDISPSGVQAVDLGLSVKWANMNIGATSMEDYGDYFAWGETFQYGYYHWNTYNWYSYDILTKYCTSSSYGTVDNKTTLESSDDAATVNWGGSWRMPTRAEQDELRTKCTWTWTIQNGVSGYKVVGPNGNSIFLPAAGCRVDSSLYGVGVGCYWSSSLYTSYSHNAYGLEFDSSRIDSRIDPRPCGESVRAVCQ